MVGPKLKDFNQESTYSKEENLNLPKLPTNCSKKMPTVGG